jgi:hypothetical protein
MAKVDDLAALDGRAAGLDGPEAHRHGSRDIGVKAEGQRGCGECSHGAGQVGAGTPREPDSAGLLWKKALGILKVVELNQQWEQL